jgi:hypothetical protein
MRISPHFNTACNAHTLLRVTHQSLLTLKSSSHSNASLIFFGHAYLLPNETQGNLNSIGKTGGLRRFAAFSRDRLFGLWSRWIFDVSLICGLSERAEHLGDDRFQFQQFPTDVD